MGKCRNDRQAIISNEQIIDLYWEREERAIQATDDKYGHFLYGIAYNILHDHSDSEECRNDTYLDIWNAIPPTRPVVFPAFISKIMRRIAIDRYKKKTSKKRIPSEMTVSLEKLEGTLHGADTVDPEYETREVGRLISDYLRMLSDRQQFIFIGRFYIAEPVQSIADELGVTASAVYKELEKLRQGLKAHLERNGVYI